MDVCILFRIVKSLVFHSRKLPVCLLLIITACGAEIEQSEVNVGSVLDKRASAMLDGGNPVNGTVVQMKALGHPISETTYKDGYPNGFMQEWSPDGLMKLEREVRYLDGGVTLVQMSEHNGAIDLALSLKNLKKGT